MNDLVEDLIRDPIPVIVGVILGLAAVMIAAGVLGLLGRL